MDQSPSNREELNELLVQTLGAPNVYFQPPDDRRMDYPCIVYELDDILTRSADNGNYSVAYRYQVTLITRDPDDPTIPKLLGLKFSSFSRRHVMSGLYHYIYVIHH